MAIGPLRIRRDNNQSNKSRKFKPELAEPFLNTVDRRLLFGDAETPGGREIITTPQSKSDQLQSLWTIAYYGGGDPARVTPLGTPRPMEVATSMLPRFALADGGKINMTGRGVYKCGSHNPRIQIYPILEAFGGERIELHGHNVDRGFEISQQTMGSNILLGFDDEWFEWSFDITIMGRSGGVVGAGGASDHNVSVTGHIEVSEFLDGNDGGGTSARVIRGQGWTPYYAFPYTRGNYRILGSTPYRSIVNHSAPTGEATDLASAIEIVNFNANTRPEGSANGPEYWHPRTSRHEIRTSAKVDVHALSHVHLALGGPTRVNPSWTILPHLGTPAGNVGYPPYYPHEHQTGITSNAGRTFVARRTHPSVGPSLTPGVDGGGGEAVEGWHRDWKELIGDMQDEMLMTHTQAWLQGGRPGFSARTYL